MTRCVVAEDESLLREALLRALAEAWPELSIVAECADGGSALEAIAEQQPEVAFLDIRMPGLTGLEVAARVSGVCRVVFVTAYDRYAVEAFEHEALDYLLKPLTDDRLGRTVRRLRAGLPDRAAPSPDLGLLLQRVAESPRAAEPPPSLRWIKASLRDGVRIVPVEEVLYFRATDKYTAVVTAEAELLIRTPLKELEDQLDPERFWRIHRAILVNAAFVEGAGRDLAGRHFVRLRGRRETLPVSRSEAHRVRQM
jgi:DNA-binding LytR/AlgR family response regulator